MQNIVQTVHDVLFKKIYLEMSMYLYRRTVKRNKD